MRADLVYGHGEAVMKPIRLCQHSVVVLVISFAILSIALSGSAFARRWVNLKETAAGSQKVK